MVGIAQLVERQVVALEVTGSSPVAHPQNVCFLQPSVLYSKESGGDFIFGIVGKRDAKSSAYKPFLYTL